MPIVNGLVKLVTMINACKLKLNTDAEGEGKARVDKLCRSIHSWGLRVPGSRQRVRFTATVVKELVARTRRLKRWKSYYV